MSWDIEIELCICDKANHCYYKPNQSKETGKFLDIVTQINYTAVTCMPKRPLIRQTRILCLPFAERNLYAANENSQIIYHLPILSNFK